MTTPSAAIDAPSPAPVAPSTPIATAARAFGDDYPPLSGQWRVRLAGLLRQRLQFAEMLMFYLNAFTVVVYLPSIACSLLGWTPLEASGDGYIQHLVPLVCATEIWLLVVNHPYYDRRRRQRRRIRALWQVRIMWTGMAPIYMKATIQAVIGGPNRKPVYKVTRKQDDIACWPVPSTGAG